MLEEMRNSVLFWRSRPPSSEGCDLYQYQELKPQQIRLFKLLPNHRDGVIRCELEHAPFARVEVDNAVRTLEYAALSYTWGPKTPLRCIQVDGRNLEIRENLWHFLSRLQTHIWRPKYLWADAICINQEDVSEKTLQVALMGQIFRCAKETFVWLGLEDADSALVMNVFKDAYRTDEACSCAKLHSTDRTVDGQRVWMATQAFFDRPYWRRSWIVQELALAQGEITVFCSADTLGYKIIYNLHEDLHTKLRIGRSKRDGMCMYMGPTGKLQHYCRNRLTFKIATAMSEHTLPMISTRRYLHPPSTLLDLLYRYKSTECTDPRDKIFSMMSLQTDIPPPLVQTILDYSMDIYELFFLLLIIYTQRHRFLPDMAKHHRRLGKIESGSTLTILGAMSMKVSASHRSVFEGTSVAHCRSKILSASLWLSLNASLTVGERMLLLLTFSNAGMNKICMSSTPEIME